MAIDVHAHYIPQSLIATARERGTQIGVRVIDGIGTAPALEFSYGFKVRPFFDKLIETASTRLAWLELPGPRPAICGDLAGYLWLRLATRSMRRLASHAQRYARRLVRR